MAMDSGDAGSEGARADLPGTVLAPNGHREEKERLTLLIDADDTLWENNIYFLEVTEQFLLALDHYGVDRAFARLHLTRTERDNIPRYGYGSRAFALSVVEAFQFLAPRGDQETVERLRRLAHDIFRRDQLEIRTGVGETLPILARHHRLVLVTKGDPEEQERKVACSGLGHHFERIEVVREKDVATYLDLIHRLDLVPSRTWMIGNSPRSDINPALAAGLNAILVPHPRTWELELEDVPEAGDRLVIVESLGDVLAIFLPRATVADDS